MLENFSLPRANDEWEDIPKPSCTWTEWKKRYKAANLKDMVKNKASGGKDQFGAANGAFVGFAPAQDKATNEPPTGMEMTDVMKSYFDNLAAAATNDNTVLETLVSSDTELTTTNAELTHTIMGLTSKNEELQRSVNVLNNRVGEKSSAHSGETPSVPKMCPNCKKVVYHKPD